MSSTSNLAKLLISGYTKDTFYGVPDDIQRICLAFYFVYDYFDKVTSNNMMIINESKTMIECDAKDGQDAFGHLSIIPEGNTIYQWTFKVISVCNISESDEIETIGIGLHNSHTSTSFFYCSDGTITHSPNWDSDDYGVKYKKLDTVRMILDNYALKFEVNDIDLGIAFHYIPLGVYRMSVSLSGSIGSPTTVQLFSYSKKSITTV